MSETEVQNSFSTVPTVTHAFALKGFTYFTRPNTHFNIVLTITVPNFGREHSKGVALFCSQNQNRNKQNTTVFPQTTTDRQPSVRTCNTFQVATCTHNHPMACTSTHTENANYILPFSLAPTMWSGKFASLPIVLYLVLSQEHFL